MVGWENTQSATYLASVPNPAGAGTGRPAHQLCYPTLVQILQSTNF